MIAQGARRLSRTSTQYPYHRLQRVWKSSVSLCSLAHKSNHHQTLLSYTKLICPWLKRSHHCAFWNYQVLRASCAGFDLSGNLYIRYCEQQAPRKNAKRMHVADLTCSKQMEIIHKLPQILLTYLIAPRIRRICCKKMSLLRILRQGLGKSDAPTKQPINSS